MKSSEYLTKESKDLARAILAGEAAGQSNRQTRGAAGRKWLIENANVEEWKRKFLVIGS